MKTHRYTLEVHQYFRKDRKGKIAYTISIFILVVWEYPFPSGSDRTLPPLLGPPIMFVAVVIDHSIYNWVFLPLNPNILKFSR